jgi:hypothetical protein
LTGEHLYANNKSENLLSALAGFPYTFFISSVIAARKISETIYYYYHNDHLGTPWALMDDQVKNVWKADYRPFGDVAISVSSLLALENAWIVFKNLGFR